LCFASSSDDLRFTVPLTWQTARFTIDLAARPQVMGIVNATPDSFSDGGHHAAASQACAHCDRLLAEGADILDIGGESTRPGSQPPPLDVELERVLPVIRHAVTLGVPVSVDTSRAEVMAAALDAGADIINDVRALQQRPGALAAVAAHPSAGVCLMHMQGEPATMQQAPQYEDVLVEVAAFLAARLKQATDAGIAADRIVLDPGYGFGKSLEHNLTLFRQQAQLLALGRPLLVGWSRKGTLGQLTGRPLDQRMPASVGAALAAVARGARIVRVHDVAATVDALKVWNAAGLGAVA
jgi:dihydropteroate synthase